MQTIHIGNRRLRCPNKRNIIIIVVVLVVIIIIVSVLLAVYLNKEETIFEGENIGAVVTNGKGCSQIGGNILVAGGSAVDAAIAALFCEGVEMPQNMGIGGGFSMTIYKKSQKKAFFLNARERAPKAATEDMFKDNATLSKKGILSVAIPGEVKGYWEAHKKYGKLPWRDLIRPTINLCTNGIRVTPYFAKILEQEKQSIESDPGLRSVFFNPKTSKVYKEGDSIQMPELAETLKIISKEGGNSLYGGSLTKKFVGEIKKLGGIITEEDMLDFKIEWQNPVTTSLSDERTLYTSVLPGSGLFLTFMINILKKLVSKENPREVRTYHRIVEAFKFGYGKRTEFGDPDFLPAEAKKLAEEMLTESYADEIVQKIHDDRTFQNIDYYGTNPRRTGIAGTANLAVLAPDGDAVVVTSTINFLFGSGILLQDTGIILNSEMDDFSAPKTANESETSSKNNVIRPNKRPLSSTVPTIVVKNGNVELAVGAGGGTRHTTAVLLIIIRHLWFGMSIEDAVKEKRFHHQLNPMSIDFEETFENIDHYVVKGLAEIGHKWTYGPSKNFAAATAISNKNGVIGAIYDWRRQGQAVYIRTNEANEWSVVRVMVGGYFFW